METKLKLQKELKFAVENVDKIRKKIEALELKNKPKSIMDMVKSFKDACELKKVKSNSIFNKKDTVDEKAYKKLKFITKVLNEDYVFNMNPDEYRYFAWFYISAGSGFVFVNAGYNNSFAGAASASRLCFKTEELAKHAATYFLQEYKDFIM